MALAIAYDDAKSTKTRYEGDASRGAIGGGWFTNFFGARETPDIPHAMLLQFDPGRVSHPHFHIVDQFQVLVDGKGKLGRHDLPTYGVHFSRAYTPYGPLVSDANAGSTFFVLHARSKPEWASFHLPKERDHLRQVPDRRPWQVTCPAVFPELLTATDPNVALQAIPGLKDEQGLAGYTLSMKPNTKTMTPDPALGEGQYLAVVQGSVLHDGRELKAPALVFVYPDDGPYGVHAGTAGLQALILNFPRAQTQIRVAVNNAQSSAGLKTWQCALCSFVYDEAAGMPEEGIAPGTRWHDVPDSWSCPDCSASKSDFQMV